MNERRLKLSKDGKYELMFSGTNYYYLYEIVNGKRKCVDILPVGNYVFDRELAYEMFDCIDNKGMEYFLQKSQYRNYFNPVKNVKSSKNLPDKFNKMLRKWERMAKEQKNPMWYVKNAEIVFRYKYQKYSLIPCNISCSEEQFEYVAREIEDDLRNMNCTDISYLGMMD